jgi:hypothetical protein
MSDFVEKLAASGHLTPEQVERIGSNVHDFLKAAEQDPALMKEAMEKLALIEGFQQGVKRMYHSIGESAEKLAPHLLTGMALTTAMGVGTGLAHDMYSGIKNSITKARDYKNMMDNNPDLKQHPAKTIQMAFDTLHKFNPEYASDPLVAGTWVRNAAGRERIDLAEVHGLVKSRSDASKARQQDRWIDPQRMVGSPYSIPDNKP